MTETDLYDIANRYMFMNNSDIYKLLHEVARLRAALASIRDARQKPFFYTLGTPRETDDEFVGRLREMAAKALG